MKVKEWGYSETGQNALKLEHGSSRMNSPQSYEVLHLFSYPDNIYW